MVKKLSISLSIALLFFTSYGQETNQSQTTYNKNIVYATYGNLIWLNQVSVSYERNVFQNNVIRFNVKLSAGKFPMNGLDLETGEKINKQYASLSGVYCMNKLELQLGVAYREFNLAAGFDPQPDIDYNKSRQGFQGTGLIGFRMEKQNFLFRAGLGNFELLYISLGFTF